MRQGLLIPVALLASLAAGQDELETTARRDIDAHYGGKTLPWEKYASDLNSASPSDRERAVTYLRALMTALQEDQINQRSGVRPDAAWGRGAADMALEARQSIVAHLSQTENPSPEVLGELEWIVGTTPETIEIETPIGYIKRIAKHGRHPRGERVQTDSRTFRHQETHIDVERRAVVVPIRAEIERVLSIRAAIHALDSAPATRSDESVDGVVVGKATDPPDRIDLRGCLSEHDTLSAQFEPFDYSLYEVLLSVRAYQAGMAEDAARVLIPVVDATASDDDLLLFVEWHLGCVIGHRMIARFCEHDLDATLILARRIVDDFPRSPFLHLARRMLVELPDRSGDWKEFRLPTPDEWTAFAKTSTREDQIRHLCARVRLVTGAQAGMFHAPAWNWEQSRDPGRADHCATSFTRGWIPVVNPLDVLKNGPLSPRDDGTGAAGIDSDDFDLVRACVKEDRLAPFVTSWRFFHPWRNVWSSSELVESLIDDVSR